MSDIFKNLCEQLKFGFIGRLGWTHKTLSRDSLSINQLGISRCETDSNQLLSWRRNVSHCQKILFLVLSFLKKKVLDFMSGSETHYRNAFIPQTAVEYFLLYATFEGIPTKYFSFT